MRSTDACRNDFGLPDIRRPVRKPSRFESLLAHLLAPPMRIHRYRQLSLRLLEERLDAHDCGKRQ